MGADVELVEGEPTWTVRGAGESLPAPLAERLAAATGEIELWLTPGEEEPTGPNQYDCTPESTLAGALLDSVGAGPPCAIPLSESVLDEPVPEWIDASSLSVVDRKFSPYFTKQGVWCLVEVSIETVSEFERDFLVSVGVDADTGEPLPLLAEVGDVVTQSPAHPGVTESEPTTVDAEVFAAAHERAHAVTEATVDEIQEQAGNAAGVEFEEYLEVQAERLETLRKERERLDEELASIRSALEAATERAERLELLDDQETRQEERSDVVAELTELEEARRDGFPAYQQKIRNRHRINAEYTIVASLVIPYQKGDLELTVTDGAETCVVSQIYGHEAAFFEAPSCGRCGETLGAGGARIVEGSCAGWIVGVRGIRS
ncbi:hypothetical protein [Halosegnis marinus]|uniref:hypothetical protein n=1 Tax=Halosegnis marinus TaxID=3034023 RepID=UPI00360F9F34